MNFQEWARKERISYLQLKILDLKHGENVLLKNNYCYVALKLIQDTIRDCELEIEMLEE